jgi:hypothetical protein
MALARNDVSGSRHDFPPAPDGFATQDRVIEECECLRLKAHARIRAENR